MDIIVPKTIIDPKEGCEKEPIIINPKCVPDYYRSSGKCIHRVTFRGRTKLMKSDEIVHLLLLNDIEPPIHFEKEAELQKEEASKGIVRRLSRSFTKP